MEGVRGERAQNAGGVPRTGIERDAGSTKRGSDNGPKAGMDSTEDVIDEQM